MTMSRFQYKRDTGLQVRMYLTVAFFLALYAGFGFLIYRLGGVSLFYIVPIMVIILLMQLSMSDRLVLGASGAKIVTAKEYPELHSIVDELVKRANLPKPRLAVINSMQPNAFATGLTKKRALVAVTTGLMQVMNREELTGVLAHELGHVQNNDMRIMSVANFFVAITSFLLTVLFFRSLFGTSDRNGSAPIFALYLVTLVVYFLGTLLMRMLSRHREYLADYSGASLTGQPQALASALAKIHTATQRVPKEQLAKLSTASALCILPAYTKRDFTSAFATHPPIKDRIAKLQKMERTKQIDYSYRWQG